MKTKNFKNRDFSYQFDNFTLNDIFQKRKCKKPKFQARNTALSFTSLEDNFLPRMLELAPILPNRYVWHVGGVVFGTDIEFVRFSIADQGLQCKHSRCKAVFANNGLTSIGSFFPYVDDRLDFYMFRDSFREEMTPWSDLLETDFW